MSPRCCPERCWFWRPACASWHATCLRLPGIAPGSPDWQSGTLLLRYDRLKPKRTNTIGLKLRPQDFTGGAFRDFRNPLSFLSLYETKNPTHFSRVGLVKSFLLNSFSKPTPDASSRNFSVVVQSPSHRNNDQIYPNGRLSLSQLNYAGSVSLKAQLVNHDYCQSKTKS